MGWFDKKLVSITYFNWEEGTSHHIEINFDDDKIDVDRFWKLRAGGDYSVDERIRNKEGRYDHTYKLFDQKDNTLESLLPDGREFEEIDANSLCYLRGIDSRDLLNHLNYLDLPPYELRQTKNGWTIDLIFNLKVDDLYAITLDSLSRKARPDFSKDEFYKYLSKVNDKNDNHPIVEFLRQYTDGRNIQAAVSVMEIYDTGEGVVLTAIPLPNLPRFKSVTYWDVGRIVEPIIGHYTADVESGHQNEEYL